MPSDFIERLRDGTNEYTIFSPTRLSESELVDLMLQVGAGQTPATHVGTQRYNRVEFKCFVINLDTDWKVGTQ